MSKQCKSSNIKDKKKYIFFMGVPFKGYVASYVIFRFGTGNEKVLWEYPVTNDV